MHPNDIALMTGILTTFPHQFPIDAKQPYTLGDDEFAGAAFYGMSGRGICVVDKKDKPFGERLPPHAAQARLQYEKLRMHAFFDRMVLVMRNDNQDGIIIAVGVDEFYYVLATWDADVDCVWVPQFDDNGRKLLPACLGE